MQVWRRRARVPRVAHEPERVTDLDTVPVTDMLAVEVRIVEAGVPHRIAHPDDFTTEVGDTDAVRFTWSGRQHGRAARREDVHPIVAARAAVSLGTEHALDGAHAAAVHRERELCLQTQEDPILAAAQQLRLEPKNEVALAPWLVHERSGNGVRGD